MIPRLALLSLRNRALTTSLTVLSVALSVALLLGIEQVRSGMREGFASTISRTDLIVGTRVGQLQLILFTVFGIGSAPDNVRYETFERYRDHPAVDWAVPYSLGDSHRGFRVVGTNSEFFERYRYRGDRQLELVEGRIAADVLEVVLGHRVAAELGYSPGDRIVVTHGVAGAPGISDHDDMPFTVVGILGRTATPVDRALYIPLEGMEAIHAGWQGGGSAATTDGETPSVEAITAFLVGVKSRIDTLRLQREINTDRSEPLLAIIPGVALAELWRGIDVADAGLKIVVLFVVVVGFLGMLVALYTTLNERRREMAILRAVGARPWKILALLMLEAGLLTTLGCLLGVILNYSVLAVARPLLEARAGLWLPLRPPTALELVYLGAVLVGGLVVGLVPAWRAYRNALADGLSVRL